MFDQAFSFGSSSNSSSSINIDNGCCDYYNNNHNHHHSHSSPQSADISPCTSPLSSTHTNNNSFEEAPLLLPAPAVMALTTQLRHHAIVDSPMLPCDNASLDLTSSSSSSSSSSSTSTTISGPDHYRPHQDEGFFDGPDSPTIRGDCYVEDDSDEFDPTLWDLSHNMGMGVGVRLGAIDSPTSSPRPSLSLEAQALSSYSQRRRQRQVLVRLQCIAQRAPDLAMLIEERHPSSLPLACEALFSKQQQQRRNHHHRRDYRSKSTLEFGTSHLSSLSRVEKASLSPPPPSSTLTSSNSCSCVRKPTKITKRATR